MLAVKKSERVGGKCSFFALPEEGGKRKSFPFGEEGPSKLHILYLLPPLSLYIEFLPHIPSYFLDLIGQQFSVLFSIYCIRKGGELEEV